MENHLDYILLIHTMALWVLGVIGGRDFGKVFPERRWLLGFGILAGAAQVLRMAGLSNPDGAMRGQAYILMSLGAWGMLWEYGRKGLKHFDKEVSAIWLLELTLLYGVFNWIGKWEGMQWNLGIFLGIPACLIAGRHSRLMRQAEPENGKRHRRVELAFYAYGISLALPMTHEIWVRLGQIAMILIVARNLQYEKSEGPAGERAMGLKVFLATLGVTLLVGGAAAYWRGEEADRAIRSKLHNQAIEIAEAIDPDQALALTFTEEDAENPIFMRFREQFTAYGKMISQKSIYTMKKRDGKIYFGPENIPQASPMASAPGTLYEEPTEACLMAFDEGKAFVEGPETDEYGEFISGLAPVTDPRTGKVIMLVGIDVSSDEWRASIAKNRLGALSFTLCMGALIIAGSILVRHLNEANEGREFQFRYSEGVFAVMAGIVLTLNVTFFIKDKEQNAKNYFFNYLAKAQSLSVKQSIDEIVRGDLTSAAHFFDSSDAVDEKEFDVFTESMLMKKALREISWIEMVPDSNGENEPVIRFVNEDQGSEINGLEDQLRLAEVRLTMNAAAKSRLPMSTSSDVMDGQAYEMVFHPVFKTSGELSGFVCALVDIRELERNLTDKSIFGDVMTKVNIRGACLMDRKLPRDEAGIHEELEKVRKVGMEWTFPIFSMGTSHAVTITPTERFQRIHPARGGWITLLAGLIATGVASAFIGMLGNRRVLLEQQVKQRTAILREINSELQAKKQEAETHNQDVMSLLNGLPGFAYLKGRDGKYLAVNRVFCDMAGMPPERVLGRTCREIYPGLSEGFEEEDRKIFSGECTLAESQAEFEFGGLKKWHLVRRLPVRRADGVVERLVGFGLDITELRRAQLSLRQLSAAIEQSPVTIVITDLQGRITFANSTFTQLTGYELSEVIGKKPSILKSGKMDDAIYRQMWETISSGGQWRGELLNRKKNGELFWELAIISPLMDENGKTTHYLGVKEDITQRKKMELELRAAARLDKLTNLPNRSLLMDRLQHAILRRRRNPSKDYAVLFLDFDRFKIVNDSLGHDVGDQLLIEISERLKSVVRVVDSVGRMAGGNTAARLGGDEFVILLDEISEPSDATVVAERILNALAKPYQIGRYRIVSTASIGVVAGGEWYDRAEDVLRDADTAMYEAKLAGKGRYVLFDMAMQKGIRRRLDMESDLRQALEKGQFELHYQPIVSLVSGAIESVEALVRWKHPEHGTISPGEFIPLAEECGLIIQLGDWVFREACRQLGKWWKDHGKQWIPGVSINLSRLQILEPDLVEHLRDVAFEAGVEPGAIHLEITESTAMRDVELAGDVLRNLKQAGFKLDMDDFGTGYSSLACLHQFPMDVLKIDRSFVMNLGRGHDYAAMVGAICALASSLNVKVIAEGIETVDQLQALMALNCHYAQGYYLGKPMPPAELENHKLPEILKLYKISA